MNILRTFTIKNLKLNKKRTIGTIIGIVLSVALICAVSGMVASFRKTLLYESTIEDGYYHVRMHNISDSKYKDLTLNKDIKKINRIYEIGYSDLGNDEYVKIVSMDSNTFKDHYYKLIDGHFPNNKNEIIINERYSVISNISLGDTISLNIGFYESNENSEPFIKNGTPKTYKVVGIFKKGSIGYNIGITTEETSDMMDAYIALKHPKNFEKDIPELFGVKEMNEIDSASYFLNKELLRWETLSFSNSTMSAFVSIATVVIIIIIITSVFCIRNSFLISTTEKTKMYGMLSSIGATKKQIKKSVIYEGLILGLIGIPIGVLCGILADYILVLVVNYIIKDFLVDDFRILFSFSYIAIIISIVLGFLTIYLSSLASSRRAGKVSPITNLRNSADIKIKKNKRTPGIIKSLFKTGGVLAYKNLKRSKKKYRTTVISLTVSIFVFISMSTFINEGFTQSTVYYKNYDYNIMITNGLREKSNEYIKNMTKLSNIKYYFIVYNSDNNILIKDKTRVNVIYEDEESLDDEIMLTIKLLDDRTFRKYVKKLNLNYNDVKTKGILNDDYLKYDDSTKKNSSIRRYKYEKNDMIVGYIDGKEYMVQVGAVTTERPYGLEHTYTVDGFIVLNLEYFKESNVSLSGVYFDSDKPFELEKALNEYDDNLNIINVEEMARAQNSVTLIISIFLYGFITVISLIGVTNIFNTITSNMELRSKEFAVFKSIGMTRKEFNRMINLETLFYSMKSLLYGITLGLIGSYLIHSSFNNLLSTSYNPPITAIIISIVFVFIIVNVIMKYSTSKINKQNIIETIRKDNI